MTTVSKNQDVSETTPRDLHDYLTTLIKQATVAYLAREQIDIDVKPACH